MLHAKAQSKQRRKDLIPLRLSTFGLCVKPDAINTIKRFNDEHSERTKIKNQ